MIFIQFGERYKDTVTIGKVLHESYAAIGNDVFSWSVYCNQAFKCKCIIASFVYPDLIDINAGKLIVIV